MWHFQLSNFLEGFHGSKRICSCSHGQHLRIMKVWPCPVLLLPTGALQLRRPLQGFRLWFPMVKGGRRCRLASHPFAQPLCVQSNVKLHTHVQVQ